MSHFVHYANDDEEEGVNVGPFDAEADAEAFAASHPLVSDVEPAIAPELADPEEDGGWWSPVVYRLRPPALIEGGQHG